MMSVVSEGFTECIVLDLLHFKHQFCFSMDDVLRYKCSECAVKALVGN